MGATDSTHKLRIYRQRNKNCKICEVGRSIEIAIIKLNLMNIYLRYVLKRRCNETLSMDWKGLLWVKLKKCYDK